MTRRRWAALLRVAVIASAALGVAGCQRQKTETPAEAARPEKVILQAEALLDRYYPTSPPKPEALPLGTDLRILAPAGYFDRYDRIDFARDRLPENLPLYVRDERRGFAPISRASAAKAIPGQDIFVYRRAPGIERFQKDYGISVAIAHITAEELRFTGIDAARTADFDLVFGPRGMLPLILDKNNLAPFEVSALTHFASSRIFITQALGHLAEDTDLDYCIPYFRSPVGIGHNLQVVAGIPRTWADGFESETTELFWHRVLLRRDLVVLINAALLYQHSLPAETLRRSQESTRQLLAQVSALAASSDSVQHKAAALQALRQKYAAETRAAQRGGAGAFTVHTATFTSIEKEAAVKHARANEVTSVDETASAANDPVVSATELLQRLLVFGADFFDERTDQAKLTTTEWAYLIGSSARPFAPLAAEPQYRFSLPSPRSPVELDLFVLPANRDGMSRQTAQFFVDYLLVPEVAASMTAFARRANLVRDSVAFLPTDITNSAVYSLPEPQDIVYLPILTGEVDRLRRLSNEILAFRDAIQAMDDTKSTDAPK